MPVKTSPSDNYIEYIGQQLDDIKDNFQVCCLDALRIDPRFSGYGADEERGTRLFFGPDRACIKILLEFEMENSYSFNGINFGSTRRDVYSALGLPYQTGFYMVRQNWYFPEWVSVHRTGGVSIETCYHFFTLRAKRMWIEKLDTLKS